MKQLVILRHAKTERHHPEGDRARRLTARGERDSRSAARALLEAVGIPDAIVSSTATRAVQTADMVAEGIEFEGPVEKAAEMYLAELEDLVRVVNGLPNAASTVVLVGHNPGFLDLINWYVGDAGARDHLPTAAFAIVTGAVETWNQFLPPKCTVSPIVAP